MRWASLFDRAESYDISLEEITTRHPTEPTTDGDE